MKRWLVVGAWVVGIAALAVLYARVGEQIIGAGTLTPAAGIAIEKAYAGLHSEAPFENLALTYPPFPIITYAIFGPIAAIVVFCATAAVALVWIALHYTKDTLTSVLLALAMVAPAVTLAAVADAAAWFFAAMLAWAVYMLARYTEREYSVYLFQAGMLIAIGVFFDLRMAAFAIAVGVLLFAVFASREFWRGVSVALVLLFPVGFFFVAWNFVQWVFTGHLAILLPPLGVRPMWEAYPAAIAAAFAVLCVAISPRASHRAYLAAVVFSPTVLIGLSSAAGVPLGAGEFALLGLACALAATTQVGNIWLRRLAALVVLVAAVALSFTLPPLPPYPLHLAIPAIPPHVVTHHEWEASLAAIRDVIAVLLAIGTVVVAIHSLRKLTGETA